MADERAAGKFLDIHGRKAHARHTQGTQGTVKSWVRGKRAWFGGGERGRPILRFLPRLF